MKTLNFEVNELSKLFLNRNNADNRGQYLDGFGFAISDYTLGHLEALCNLSDDSLSRDRLYYLAELFGFVPKIGF